VFDEDAISQHKKKKSEAELDITPMIDVTFLLLIFFMVTSTMQANKDRDIPTATSGGQVNTVGMLEIVVLAPTSRGADCDLLLEGKPATQEEIQAQIQQEATTGEVEVMVMAEGQVPNGVIGEIEALLGEIEGVTYHFGVQEKR
jgi:biopolymer transport protein ExbD